MKTVASLSLDLDNLWAYQMTHGDDGWEKFPTYIDVLIPAVLRLLDEVGLKITFFIVGQDAALPINREPLAAITASGHRVANHSFRHQPWLHRYSPEELANELTSAADAIEAVCGQRPVGFRGPGYSLSATVLDVLVRQGYRYDASTLPTLVGPLARAFYFRSAKLTVEQRRDRSNLFGGWQEGFRRLKPYRWDLGDGRTLLEIPVTTMPLARVPIHISYVLYLAGVSPSLAQAYFRSALRICRIRGVQPSILLHPLDVLGADDTDKLAFFPGMHMAGARKVPIVRDCLAELGRQFDVVTMERHAELLQVGPLPTVTAERATPASERVS